MLVLMAREEFRELIVKILMTSGYVGETWMNNFHIVGFVQHFNIYNLLIRLQIVLQVVKA